MSNKVKYLTHNGVEYPVDIGGTSDWVVWALRDAGIINLLVSKDPNDWKKVGEGWKVKRTKKQLDEQFSEEELCTK